MRRGWITAESDTPVEAVREFETTDR